MKLALPHHRFTLLWILHTLLGIALGYAVTKTIDVTLSILAIIGIYALANFQHLYHYLSGSSSTLYRMYPHDKYRVLFEKAFIFFAVLMISTVILIAVKRPLIPYFAILGALMCILYAKTHIEELWGIANALNTVASYYVATGLFPPVPLVLVILGFCIVCNCILLLYRALTGDYDNPEIRPKKLMKAYLEYNLGLGLIVLGLFLM